MTVRFLPIAAAFATLVFSGLAFAATLPLNCELQLVQQVVEKAFNPPDLDSFLKKASEQEATTIDLPFTFSTTYEAGLLEIPSYEFQTSLDCNALYLAYSKPTKIFKFIGSRNIESWHASRIDFEGFHFVMGFESVAARELAFERIYPQFKSHMIADSVKPFRGKAQIEGLEKWLIVVPSMVSFMRIHNEHAQVGTEKKTQKPYVPAHRADLEAIATSESKTSGGTKYYFKGDKPIGFTRKGKSYRFVETDAPYVNVASHQEIIRSQLRRMGRAVSLEKPLEAFDEVERLTLGRKLLDDWIESFRKESSLGQDEIAGFDQKRQDRETYISVLLNSASLKYPSTLNGSLAYFGKENLERFAKIFDSAPEALRKQYAFLREFTADISPLRKGDPNSERLFRFVYVAKESVSMWGFFYSEVGDNTGTGSLLHEQMVRLAFGTHLTETFLSNPSGPNKLTKLLHGGLVHIKYDENGKPSSVKIPEGSEMGLLEHNLMQGKPLKMTDAENKALEKDLLAALKRSF